jgi:hypothetical protein
LSSTTDTREERGQILVLFAAALTVLFLVAALAFDAGMLFLERRDQQNAADAAALGGARYVLGATPYNGTCAGAAGHAAATAACEVALENDFDDALADENVYVHIPPIDGDFAGFAGFVQVRIEATRAPIFAGIMGQNDWEVGARAVAANQPGLSFTFGMLALNETACKAIHISGTGTVNSAASVQSNSSGEDCDPGDPQHGLSRTGAGELNVTAPDAVCRSVGEIQDEGSGTMTCTPAEFSFALPDPLAALPAPAKPALAAGMKEMVGTTLVDTPADIPADCPGATGSDAPSETSPSTCVLGQGGGQANRQWILSPGLYPAGLDLKGGVTAYLLPGIYWIGGGGFQTSNNASVISVESETDLSKAVCTVGATPPCVGGGGVLIYNSSLPAAGAAGAPGPISMGGGGTSLSLQPYEYPWGSTTIDLVIFQDRTVTETVTLNGSSVHAADVRGIVYVPAAHVKVNGSSSTFTMDQVIADTFLIDGSGGTVNILRETGVDVEVSGAGLVE